VHYGKYPGRGLLKLILTPQRLGKFVSESKFIDKPSAFIPHIQNPNRLALEALITKPEVELKLLHRLRKKAATYGQDFAPDGEALKDSIVNGSAKVDVDGVVDLYESYIIPLTKEIEVSLNLYISLIAAKVLSLSGGLSPPPIGWVDTR
jgi:chorismate mutase